MFSTIFSKPSARAPNSKILTDSPNKSNVRFHVAERGRYDCGVKITLLSAAAPTFRDSEKKEPS
jgi:hypothetical protein